MEKLKQEMKSEKEKSNLALDKANSESLKGRHGRPLFSSCIKPFSLPLLKDLGGPITLSSGVAAPTWNITLDETCLDPEVARQTNEGSVAASQVPTEEALEYMDVHEAEIHTFRAAINCKARCQSDDFHRLQLLQSEHKILQELFEKKETELKELRSGKSALEEHVVAKEKETGKALSDLAVAKAAVSTLESTVKDRDAEIGDMRKRAEAVETEKDQLSASLEEARKRLEEADRSVASLIQEREEVKQSAKEAELWKAQFEAVNQNREDVIKEYLGSDECYQNLLALFVPFMEACTSKGIDICRKARPNDPLDDAEVTAAYRSEANADFDKRVTELRAGINIGEKYKDEDGAAEGGDDQAEEDADDEDEGAGDDAKEELGEVPTR